MSFQPPLFSEALTNASQGSYRWRTVLLGLNAGSTFIEKVFQLCDWQVIKHQCYWTSLIDFRMAHRLGLAGNSRIRVLSCRGPDPGVNHPDQLHLHFPSMAYGSSVLGVNRVHYLYEHHCRKVPTQV